jgi:hypothetical protein
MSAPKLQPALLGGAVLGVLSALPFVNVANCCCIWVITGGVVAAWLMQQHHPLPVTAGDGATVGLLAGLFGAVVWAVLYLPIHAVTGSMQQRMIGRALSNAAELPPAVQQALEQAERGGGSVVFLMIGFVFMLFVSAIFSTLGGLVGAMLFQKTAPPQPPGSLVPPLPPTP